MREYAEGIDISDAGQGVFNWAPWEGHIDFAIMKATEGETYIDPQFSRNWAHATAQGIEKLAYHYGHPSEDPAKQAQHFVNTLVSVGHEHAGMVLDIEITEGMKPLDVAFWCFTFEVECRRLTGRKLRMIDYSYQEFILAGNLAKSRRPLWIAEPGVPEPTMPVGPYKSWAFWQYAWNTSGRAGPNLDRFNGDVKDLRKFLRG